VAGGLARELFRLCRRRVTPAVRMAGRADPLPSITGSDDPEGHHAVRRLDDFVDETLTASCPASDPPGWMLGGSQRDPHEPEDLETMTHRAQARPKIYVTSTTTSGSGRWRISTKRGAAACSWIF
jgi:hypothetical protein